MSLARRIIPTLLCRGRQLVKGERFNAWRSVGVVAQAVRIFQERGVDELVLLDIGATPENRGPDLDLVAELAEVCYMPLAVGGGIVTPSDARALLRHGADKVVVGAGGPQVIAAIADSLGCQAVIAAIDVNFMCEARGTGKIHYLEQIARVQQAGAGEILLTAMEREGTMAGYDLDLIRPAAKIATVPLIAHGGCGNYDHMREAFEAGADAVAAGAMFQFSDATPRAAARYLAAKGFEVRA